MVLGLVLVSWDTEPGPASFRVAMEGVGVGGPGGFSHRAIQAPRGLGLDLGAILRFEPLGENTWTQWRHTPT